MATPQPVRIENSGEYPLSVSSVVVQGEPQWALDDGFPFDVPGATGAGPGARDVMVLFKPNAIGKVDNGLMQLQSNDALRGNISIVLLGNGKERAVKTFPPTIELGDTGAGVPTRLSLVDPSQMLVMTNMDDITDFTIREIKMQGIDADIDKIFTIQTMDGDSVGGTVLPHGNQPRTFDVLFTPPQLGNYEANIAIYLDEDSESQVTIPIHGRALFVDAHGGGGCSTTDTSGAGGMLFAIGAFAFARRRRTA
jgi:MYXO-CTERM domain-containing protein